MKTKKNLFKLAILTSVLSLGIGVAAFKGNDSLSKAKAEQFLDDYDPYIYNGSYYDDIDFDDEEGMDGDLRKAITSLIKPKGFYTYGSQGEEHLATQLQYADEDPNNSNNMIYFYTRDSVKKNSASTWNREHVWCQSLSNGNWGDTQGGTDVLHLRPTYNSVNSSRGNKPYGDNNKSGANYYDGMLYGYSSGSAYFEPIDQVKGDVARIVMYVWTTYTGWSGYSSLDILKVFQNYDLLLSWHTMDRPDALEGNRNNYAQASKQKNRNPFVDHPELAWKIFGDKVSTSVKNACIQAYPSNGGDPIDPTGITLNKSIAFVQVGKTVKINASLQPSGATGDVSWSSSNTSIATVNNNGIVTGVSLGSAVITARCGEFSASCTVTVESGANYGSAENPLTLEQAKAIIDINGTNLSEQPIYIRGTISSNSAYNSQYGNYDAIWLKSDDGTIDDDFELYRTKLSGNISGNFNAANSMKDCEIVAYGYGKIYNGTYELCHNNNARPNNPIILSLVNPTQSSIELDEDLLELEVGDSAILTATVEPASLSDSVIWESSNDEVASVDDGIVAAEGVGTATITAKLSESVKAECEVIVSKPDEVFTLASSIEVGNFVCLTSNNAGMQFVPPSLGEDKYGTGVNFENFPKNSVSSFEIKAGYVVGSYAFRIATGDNQDYYLTYTGSNNSLRLMDSITEASSWNVTIDENNNATITNVGTPTRVIWWYNTNPRFSCYENKSANNVYYNVQLWKSNNTVSYELDDLLSSASAFANLEAKEETSKTGSGLSSVTMADLGYENAEDVTSIYIGSHVVMSPSIGTNNSNGPKYYTSDATLRLYSNNKIEFTSDESIMKIEFTFASGYSSGLSTYMGTLTDGNVWTGNASSITFNVGSTIRIKSISVTCGESVTTLSDVAMRFCGSMPRTVWNTIASKWTIADYGVMLAKKTTLYDVYGMDSIEEAFICHKALTVHSKGSGEAPISSGDDYIFNSKVSVNSASKYDLEICAAPFIVVDGNYYFFGELEFSINTLAEYYQSNEGCDLSDTALEILAGN